MIPVCSLIVLAAVIAISVITKKNAGIIAIIAAFLFSVIAAACGVEINPAKIVSTGWPMTVFFIVLATTFLFGIANLNGTTEALSKNIVCLARGNAKLLPILFFLLGAVVSGAGAGGLIVAVIMPVALYVAVENNISVLMMSLVTMGGIMVGGLSPLAINGIVAKQLALEQGLENYGAMWLAYGVSMTIFSIAAYLIFGGLMGAVSSGTGVVMPTLIPLASQLAAEMGTVSATRLVIGVIVGTNGVVISPLSTVGGIAVGSAPESVDKDKLYNQLLLAAVSFIVLNAIASALGLLNIFG